MKKSYAKIKDLKARKLEIASKVSELQAEENKLDELIGEELSRVSGGGIYCW